MSNPFAGWDDARVAAHNARVQPANRIPEKCPICNGQGEYTDKPSLVVTHCEGCNGTGLYSPQKPPPKSGQSESDLHDQILAEVRRRGWIAFHSRMDRRTTQQPGIPDFVILGRRHHIHNGAEWTDQPFTLLIEVKTRTGKLSPAQFAMKHHAEKLGHTIQTVRDFARFKALL